MNYRLKPVAATLVLLALPLTTYAESLKEAAEQAVLRNPEVTAKWHGFKAAVEDKKAAKGGWLPRVDLNAYAGREHKESPSVKSTTFNHPGASIELRQLIFDGFGVSSNIERLGFTAAARYYELLAASDDAALEAARAYIDVQRYTQLATLAQENYAVHKEIHDQIQQRVTAGVGRRVDLEQAGGRLALAESNWLTEASNLHDVSARYERLIGRSPRSALEALPDLQGKLPPNAELMPRAVSRNPLIQTAKANIQAAKANVNERKSAHYPTLELRASQAVDRDRDGIDGTHKDGSIRLVLNYNLFNGGGDQARIRAAAENMYTAVDQREKACRDIRQITRIAWNDNLRLKEQQGYLEQHELSTTKARDAYRQQFDIGQRSLLDVLDTENELFEARRAVVRARHDRRLAEIRVLAATHDLLPALGLSALPGDDEVNKHLINDDDFKCPTDLPSAMPLDRSAAMAGRPALTPTSLPAQAPAAKPMAGTPEEAIRQTVTQWAAAWRAKEFDAFASHYANSFSPENQQPNSNWQAQRRARLAKAGSISVVVEDISIKLQGKDKAQVNFLQRYRSDSYSDNVMKQLDMVLEQGAWKINREMVTQTLPK
ncbi:adhesin transport system outer membrane protein [Chitinivorax tropicus]|uniref:Adhesin transport system outer membrane protein n=1 Tax=Chitinivorax tropicus TaxID=714531 RepID=A0A840MM64_9PROT|nr:TolC family outer membrane protein [Chitinivorax tropicus]MBB5018219.1 adhesin transport system outer membrane protein [Chitinivorax tropicus]